MIEAHPAQTLVARASAAFAAYQDGDRAAFDDLVEVVTPLMWRTVRSTGADTVTGEDVLQTVWMSLLHSAASIRDPQTVVKWLLTSTRREAWRVSKRGRADRGRTAAVFGVDEEEAMAPLAVPGQREAAPEEAVFRDERQRRLWRHVQDLSERCRRLLSVVAFADKPDYAHLAEALGMPVGSIGPTRGRCLAKLREALTRDPHWEGLLG